MTGRNLPRTANLSRGSHHPPTVVVNRIDIVGLRLAIRLIDAGYRVLGVQVLPQCREEFATAGGRIVEHNPAAVEADWVVTLPHTGNPRPEDLAGLLAVAPTRWRPRVSLLGGAGALEDLHQRAVATLRISPGFDLESDLTVHLAVGRLGTELGVSGDQDLFERALPLLTALSDRVLFASGGMHSRN
jgi:hypothetical protein